MRAQELKVTLNAEHRQTNQQTDYLTLAVHVPRVNEPQEMKVPRWQTLNHLAPRDYLQDYGKNRKVL